MPMTLPDRNSVVEPTDGAETTSAAQEEKVPLRITEAESPVTKLPKKVKKRKVLAITQGPVDDQDGQTADIPITPKPVRFPPSL